MRGAYRDALQILSKKSKKAEKRNDRFVYYLDRATTAFYAGEVTQSNTYFEKAYLFGEDYKGRFFRKSTDLINPTIKLYTGEKHEHLLPLYYKVLNYIDLGNYEAALVECRRLNLRLNELSDKHKEKKKSRRYRRDAFVHTLMGLLYESQGDLNNAFIAYRNAYEIYTRDYADLFGVGAPEQLKKDLQRTASAMGFYDELTRLQKEMDVVYAFPPPKVRPREVVVFWNNGLGPYKETDYFTFVLVSDSRSGVVVFQNEALGMSFPFPYRSKKDKFNFNSLNVAFPRYIARPPRYTKGSLRAENGETYAFELVEDVTAVARQCLQERMLWTFSTNLLRVALREVAEGAIREKSEGLGLLADVLGSVSEQADTRCWQTLPHSIHYVRVPLPVATLKTNERQPLLLSLEGDAGDQISDTLWVAQSPTPISFHHLSTTAVLQIN